jgi:protein SDA1
VVVFSLTTRVRTDPKAVSIIALGCFHPTIKVQSASIHFFLGHDEEKEDSDDGDDVRFKYDQCVRYLTALQLPDVRALHHRREINKKRRGDDKKLRRNLKSVKKVCAVFRFPFLDQN